METIIDIIPHVRKIKWLGLVQKAYCIIITDQRTVFAKIDNKKLNEHMQKARQDAGAKGEGLFGKMKAQMQAAANYSERYRTMKLEEIVSEHPENQSLTHQDITKIKVRYVGHVYNTDETYQHRNQSTITYKTNTEKLKFNTQGDWRKRLKELYQGKVKVV